MYIMKDIHSTALEILKKLTLEEKASLCSGSDYWHTKSVERLGLFPVTVSDGPHGLRKQDDAQDNFGIGVSVPATCFPTASLTACSFDSSILEKLGNCIAEECIHQNVDVILGPGVNIKRSPLCGRNFEYFSEDPMVAGKLAASFIKGVQDKGIGCSLKHYAVNNQEKNRMLVNAIVDKRARNEIYLRPFEIAVKESNPQTVMTSYNKINGIYGSENKTLIAYKLRKIWGFKGMTVSDWNSVHKRSKGIKAGLNLEMPGNKGANDRKILEAIKWGNLSVEQLDDSVIKVIEFILQVQEKNEFKKQIKENSSAFHHQQAIEIAQESMVLLKNQDDLLPLSKSDKIAVIGNFAVNPRYQGAGSSRINPIKIEQPLLNLKEAGFNVEFSDGSKIKQALEISSNSDKVIIFAGLTDGFETEGIDRDNMEIPQQFNKLINEICLVNKNVIVVLMGGSPMELPWKDKVKSILLAYLGGEGTGKAIANILSGQVNPSGKLAETWPLKAQDCLSSRYFPGDRKNVLYKESLFVGYRYFNSVNKQVQFNFGHGLSYTKFEYSQLQVKNLEASFKVKNTGNYAGKEICFAWCTPISPVAFVPKKQLAGFTKVFLKPGEVKIVTINLDKRVMKYFNNTSHEFEYIAKDFIISVAGNIDDTDLKQQYSIDANIFNSQAKDKKMTTLSENSPYRKLSEGINIGEISNIEFAEILGRKPPEFQKTPSRPFTMENCFEDTTSTLLGKLVKKIILIAIKIISRNNKDQRKMMLAAVMEIPFYSLWVCSNGIVSESMMKFLIGLFNIGPRHHNYPRKV